MAEQLRQKSGNKAKGRQSTKHKGYYAAQFYVSERNKALRLARYLKKQKRLQAKRAAERALNPTKVIHKRRNPHTNRQGHEIPTLAIRLKDTDGKVKVFAGLTIDEERNGAVTFLTPMGKRWTLPFGTFHFIFNHNPNHVFTS